MRYESEWQTLVNLKSHKKSNECFTVLLALSISDLEKLLSYLPSWLSRNKVSKVLIKPHPATEKQIPIIMQTIRNTPILNDYLMRGDLEVVTGNILTFFESSDVLLTGDSSVGVEAKIAGLEVQTVAWGDQVNLYPLTEGSVVDHIKILEENH
jgi:hypothetical protein